MERRRPNMTETAAIAKEFSEDPAFVTMPGQTQGRATGGRAARLPVLGPAPPPRPEDDEWREDDEALRALVRKAIEARG
jgi:hypothetical protein